MPERPRPRGLDAVVARRIESGPEWKPEMPPREKRVDVEALFAELKDLADASIEADRLMIEFAEAEPKVRDILNTPQSPDKHAEGPTVKDHYRSILSAIVLIRDGKMPYPRAQEVLGIENAEQEWNEVERVVREHPNLLIAFAFMHDVAKPDTLGFLVRDGSPAVELGFATKAIDKEIEKRKDKAKDAAKKGDIAPRVAFDAEQDARRADLRAKYDKLFAEFSSTRQDLDPMDLQKQFFDAYGISISYRGHAEEAYDGANREVVDRVADRLNLTDQERKLLRYSIEQHINPLLKFERVEGKDVHGFVDAAEEAGLDPKEAMRALQAGMLVDGLIGTVKLPKKVKDGVATNEIDTAGDAFIYTAPLTNFWKAEQLYPAYRVEVERKKAEEEAVRQRSRILKDVGLDGDALKALGIQEGADLGRTLGMIRGALQGDGKLPGVQDEALRSELESRIEQVNIRLATPKE